jgi:hypothetical protein
VLLKHQCVLESLGERLILIHILMQEG